MLTVAYLYSETPGLAAQICAPWRIIEGNFERTDVGLRGLLLSGVTT